MNKQFENKSSTSQKQKLTLINTLVKSVAGLIGIVILLSGLVLLIVFQPEITAMMPSDSSKNIATIASFPEPTDLIIDGKDMETGLLAGEGFEIVKGTCTACHSSAIILQSGFTREGWHEKIVWMQETQGLWNLGENESVILDYLAANYGIKESQGRRKPLTGIDWYELKD